MQLWKVSVPSGGRGGILFVDAPAWFGARALCRALYHDEALEKNWNSMTPAPETSLVPGDIVVFKDRWGGVQTKIVPKPPRESKSPKKAKTRKK